MHEILDADIDTLLASINGQPGRSRPIVLDAARRGAIRGYENIQACPGSGKTTLLGLKLMLLAKNLRNPYEGICVLSHTNVAKDEISKWIAGDSQYDHLLRYPNFLGTIQEFINRFIALPYARSRGWHLRIVDDDLFDVIVKRAMRSVVSTQAPRRGNGNLVRLSSFFLGRNASYADLRFEASPNGLQVNNKILQALDRHVNLQGTGVDLARLNNVRAEIARWGYVTYAEMYALAQQALNENPQIIGALRARFRIVLCDEMQDTQQHQEQILEHLFRYDGSYFQCLGDPDQAIFDGMGNSLPNQNYNQGTVTPIALSHRFTPNIARVTQGISIRKLEEITTSLPLAEHDLPVTLILFRDGEEQHVLETFAYLANQLPEDKKVVLRAVGAVSKEAGDRLTILSYFPGYSRAN